jgi:preprotein translocase subunit SecG
MVFETLMKVLQVLVALAMTGFILVQRGSGAQAGSGFGAGASGTVFGARGAASFLTRATAVLATVFFVISMTMAVYTARTGIKPVQNANDLGIMSSVVEAEKTPVDVPKADAATTPPAAATQADVPQAPAAAPADTKVPAEKPKGE